MRVALVLLLLASTSHAAGRREVAITFDDLPATHGSPKEVNAKLLRTIRAHGIPAIGFVNEGKLYEDGDLSADRVALLRQWLDAGLELGNHTFSHISIDRASLEQVFAHFEQLSRDFLGYEMKQVLLVHANELNADHFDELVGMMKRRGYRFISLHEALKDPAYRLPDAQSSKGLSWIHRWMLAKGQPMRPEPLEPEWVSRQFRANH